MGAEPARASRSVFANIPTSLCLHKYSCASTGSHTPLEDRQARLSVEKCGYIRGAKPRLFVCGTDLMLTKISEILCSSLHFPTLQQILLKYGKVKGKIRKRVFHIAMRYGKLLIFYYYQRLSNNSENKNGFLQAVFCLYLVLLKLLRGALP